MRQGEFGSDDRFGPRSGDSRRGRFGSPVSMWPRSPAVQRSRRLAIPAESVDLLEQFAATAVVFRDGQTRHRGEFVLTGARDRLESLAAPRLQSTRRDRPTSRAGVIGRSAHTPPVWQQVQDVEGALTLRGLGHEGDARNTLRNSQTKASATRANAPQVAIVRGRDTFRRGPGAGRDSPESHARKDPGATSSTSPTINARATTVIMTDGSQSGISRTHWAAA
jgi:hypothetical protein